MRWDDSIDGELDKLDELANNGWAWHFPGWQWVADRLNEEFKNGRTANACRMKFERAFCNKPTVPNNKEVITAYENPTKSKEIG